MNSSAPGSSGTTTPSDDADPLGTLSRRKSMNWRTYVVPEYRMMFVQVNKNACTSIKWMIADIAGEELAEFRPGTEASTNRFDDIHDRRQWKKVPLLGDIDPGLRAQIRPDNGWFIFGVTRDPRSRLFSAWQSKLLLNNPGYRSFRSAPWYPRQPVSKASIVEDFTRFVELFERKPDIGIRRDGHFRDQVEMLHEDLVTYTEIYDIRELDRLKSDLRVHLEAAGWRGEELFVPRVNDTPVRANAAVFADGLRERVEKVYATDFERFGDRWDFAHIAKVPEWTTDQFLEIDQLADHGSHIGVLLETNAALRADVARYRKQAKTQTRRADELAGRLTSADTRPLSQHLRSDLRRAAAGVRRRLHSR